MADDKPVLMPTTMFPIDHGGVLTAAAKAAGFVEIASTPAISHDEIKERRGFPVRFPDWDGPPEAPINCSYCMASGIDPDNGLE